MMYELRIDPASGIYREGRTIATTNTVLEAIKKDVNRRFGSLEECDLNVEENKFGPFVGGFRGSTPTWIFDGYFPSKSFASLPHPKHVMVNGDYTTVVWEDGSHTIVKKMAGDADDPEKAIMYAIFKRMFYHDGSAMKRYFKEFEDKTIVKKKAPKTCCRNCKYEKLFASEGACKTCLEHSNFEPKKEDKG